MRYSPCLLNLQDPYFLKGHIELASPSTQNFDIDDFEILNPDLSSPRNSVPGLTSPCRRGGLLSAPRSLSPVPEFDEMLSSLPSPSSSSSVTISSSSEKSTSDGDMCDSDAVVPRRQRLRPSSIVLQPLCNLPSTLPALSLSPFDYDLDPFHKCRDRTNDSTRSQVSLSDYGNDDVVIDIITSPRSSLCSSVEIDQYIAEFPSPPSSREGRFDFDSFDSEKNVFGSHIMSSEHDVHAFMNPRRAPRPPTPSPLETRSNPSTPSSSSLYSSSLSTSASSPALPPLYSPHTAPLASPPIPPTSLSFPVRRLPRGVDQTQTMTDWRHVIDTMHEKPPVPPSPFASGSGFHPRNHAAATRSVTAGKAKNSLYEKRRSASISEGSGKASKAPRNPLQLPYPTRKYSGNHYTYYSKTSPSPPSASPHAPSHTQSSRRSHNPMRSPSSSSMGNNAMSEWMRVPSAGALSPSSDSCESPRTGNIVTRSNSSRSTSTSSTFSRWTRMSRASSVTSFASSSGFMGTGSSRTSLDEPAGARARGEKNQRDQMRSPSSTYSVSEVSFSPSPSSQVRKGKDLPARKGIPIELLLRS